MQIKLEHKLILALDVTDRHTALNVVKSVERYIDAVKISYPLVLSEGPEIIKLISKKKCVLCDFKVADVPHTNRLIVKSTRKLGAAGIIIHGFCGVDAAHACIDAAEDMDVYVVTELTNPGAEQFAQGDRIAKIAVELNATGVIAPATKPHRISAIRNIVGNLKILAPGIGIQGGDARKAIDAGADAIIVGRLIYDSPDPASAAKSILKTIK